MCESTTTGPADNTPPPDTSPIRVSKRLPSLVRDVYAHIADLGSAAVVERDEVQMVDGRLELTYKMELEYADLSFRLFLQQSDVEEVNRSGVTKVSIPATHFLRALISSSFSPFSPLGIKTLDATLHVAKCKAQQQRLYDEGEVFEVARLRDLMGMQPTRKVSSNRNGCVHDTRRLGVHSTLIRAFGMMAVQFYKQNEKYGDCQPLLSVSRSLAYKKRPNALSITPHDSLLSDVAEEDGSKEDLFYLRLPAEALQVDHKHYPLLRALAFRFAMRQPVQPEVTTNLLDLMHMGALRFDRSRPGRTRARLTAGLEVLRLGTYLGSFRVGDGPLGEARVTVTPGRLLEHLKGRRPGRRRRRR